MHIQYVAICEQVLMAADGRPSLINVFNDVAVASFPATLPRLAFAARLLMAATETGKTYKVEVIITDPSGTEIGRPGGDVQLPPPPPGVDSVAIDLPLQFDLFPVNAEGRYTFLLTVDGEKKSAVQLAVRQGALA